MEMTDFTWQHQKNARPDIYVFSYLRTIDFLLGIFLLKNSRIINISIGLEYKLKKNSMSPKENIAQPKVQSHLLSSSCIVRTPL